jgi:PTS system fructose-specific IIC component
MRWHVPRRVLPLREGFSSRLRPFFFIRVVPVRRMNIHELITPRTIRVPLASTDKRGAIDELVNVLRDAGKVSDAETLRRVIWEREQQRSTGIGEGLAIPHGKCACVERLAMAIGIAAPPIEFESIDRKPVRMIALVASHPDRFTDHIQALGKLSRLMTRVEFREAAYAASSAEALYDLFEQAEAAAAQPARA